MINKWYNKFDETTKRQYFELQDYKVKLPGEKEPIKPSSNDKDAKSNETELNER